MLFILNSLAYAYIKCNETCTYNIYLYIMVNFIALRSSGALWSYSLCLLPSALAALVITESTEYVSTLVSLSGYLLKIPTYEHRLVAVASSPALPAGLLLSESLPLHGCEHFAHEVQLRRRCNFFYVRVAAAIAASPARWFVRSHTISSVSVCMSVCLCMWVCVCDDAAPPPLSCVCVENCVPPAAHI